MASECILQDLLDIERSGLAQQDKLLKYNDILKKIKTSAPRSHLAANYTAFVDAALKESMGIVAARPVLGSFVESLSALTDNDIKIAAGQYALSALQPRVVSFEEQDSLLRETVAEAFTAQENYMEAAKTLQGIQFESSQRRVSDDAKVSTWIRICRLYLEEDDIAKAEAYLNRAKSLIYKVQDKELNLKFQLSQARISDSHCKFQEASQIYHTVSSSSILDEDDRLQSLSKAIICGVLAPAGPQRSKNLAKLFKDEKSTQLEEFGILEKVFLDRLVSPPEVTKFASKLAPHQLARTADGSTVLTKAIVEHNLLAISRLYENVHIDELGTLIGLEAGKVEEYSARMLEQGRLDGLVDQIDGTIIFRNNYSLTARDDISFGSHSDCSTVRGWDINIQALTEDVEHVSSLLQSQCSRINCLTMSV